MVSVLPHFALKNFQMIIVNCEKVKWAVLSPSVHTYVLSVQTPRLNVLSLKAFLLQRVKQMASQRPVAAWGSVGENVHRFGLKLTLRITTHNYWQRDTSAILQLLSARAAGLMGFVFYIIAVVKMSHTFVYGQ